MTRKFSVRRVSLIGGVTWAIRSSIISTRFGTVPRPSGAPQLYFALPGNPGASSLMFDQFVRPAIRAMTGARPIRRPRVMARMLEPWRKPVGIAGLVRGQLCERDGALVFRAALWQGSMSVRSLSGLGAVAIAPPEIAVLEAGALVAVESWGPVVAMSE